MPIPNYVRPQLTIEQILQRTPDATTDRISAVVIGREYLINRVGVPLMFTVLILALLVILVLALLLVFLLRLTTVLLIHTYL